MPLGLKLAPSGTTAAAPDRPPLPLPLLLPKPLLAAQAAREQLRALCAQAAHALHIHGAITVMYLPTHIFFSIWALFFAFLPSHAACMGCLAFLALYYARTMAGEPQHTGRPAGALPQ